MHAAAAQSHRLFTVAPAGLARWILIVIAVALVLALPTALRDPHSEEPARIASAQLADWDGTTWSPVRLDRLTLPDGSGLLRVDFDIDPEIAASEEPLGLYLSGTFSASALWNGVPVGAKGMPGEQPSAERAGQIDVVLHLPSHAVQPGRNMLLLQISSHRLTHAVTSVIHGTQELYGLRVAPFSADARRPIGYYATPFLMSGILLAALLAVTIKGRGPGAGRKTWAVAIAAALLFAALAEVSRAALNYSYFLHDLRMSAIAGAAWTASVAIICHAAGPFVWAVRPRATFGAAVGVVTAAALLPTSPLPMLMVAATIGIVLALRRALAREPQCAELAVALLVIVGFALAEPSLFMDRGLYASCLPLVAHLAWTRARSAVVESGTPALSADRAASDRLIVRTAGVEYIVLVSAIRSIHAAGDYAEIVENAGRRLLDDRSITALAAQLPSSFFRVHRSHVVNLRCVSALRSHGGGKYDLLLTDGSSIPVSRARVTALRAALAGEQPSEIG